MARGVSNSSSRKTCPPNKFSIFSGCMSWDMALALFAMCSLIVVCFLVMSNKNNSLSSKNSKLKKNDIVEEEDSISFSRNRNLTINGELPLIMKRVDEKYQPNDTNTTYNSPNDGTGTPTSERINYDVNINTVNIRDTNPERPNMNMISYAQYDADKSMERIINPLLPPERSYQNTYGIPINVPSRGPNMSYQQVGILYKENIENPDKQPGNNNDSNILPLFGRSTFNGSNKWNYYTSSDKFQNFKLPIKIDGRKCDDDLGCNELRDGDMISIPSYNGRFRVEIYNYDKPRYIPFIY